MALRSFIIVSLFLAVVAYFIPIENYSSDKNEEELAQVIFEDAKMFTINDIGVSRKIDAKRALNYKTKDILEEGNIVLFNQEESKDFSKEFIKAKTIIKIKDNYTLKKDVEYKRDNFVKLNTEYLEYNETNKIAQNTHAFKGMYNSNSYIGTNLYLDAIKDEIKSKNTHFEIEMKKGK